MLKKRRRKRKREKVNKQGRENFKENIGTKLITNTKKQKLKIQSRVWNFKNTMLKKEEEKEREKKQTNKQTNKNKQYRKNHKENTGTKLISNTKKHKLKIQNRVWNFRYTMLFKRRRERNREKEKIKKRHRNYIRTKIKKKNYRYKIDNKYQKAKIKNLEQSLEFQKYNVKEKKTRVPQCSSQHCL